MESNFNPTASASTSSARGLYQFIDQTWLGTVKEAGAQLGYGNYADAISKSPSGNYSVSDPAARNAIMKLRDDPAAASSMAAVLTHSNSFKLTGKIGRRPTDGELYMAHFMGVGGAAKLISNAEDNPQASGARLFPNAAAANRSIFFERLRTRAKRIRSLFGTDLSLCRRGELPGDANRNGLGRRYPCGHGGRQRGCRPAGDRQCEPIFRPFPMHARPRPSRWRLRRTASASPGGSAFRSLFQAGDRTEPVSPAVRELWGNSSSPNSRAFDDANAGGAANPNSARSRPLDLFSDPNGTFS